LVYFLLGLVGHVFVGDTDAKGLLEESSVASSSEVEAGFQTGFVEGVGLGVTGICSTRALQQEAGGLMGSLRSTSCSSIGTMFLGATGGLKGGVVSVAVGGVTAGASELLVLTETVPFQGSLLDLGLHSLEGFE
jgi:hypothetical protein